jgi:hypothetical protein
MVDYFIKVGDFLKQFDGSIVDVPYTVLQDGYSVKKTYVGSVTTRFYTGNHVKNFQTHTAQSAQGSVTDVSYVRRRGPLSYSGIALPELALPDLRQSVNIAEIAFLASQR